MLSTYFGDTEIDSFYISNNNHRTFSDIKCLRSVPFKEMSIISQVNFHVTRQQHKNTDGTIHFVWPETIALKYLQH